MLIAECQPTAQQQVSAAPAVSGSLDLAAPAVQSMPEQPSGAALRELCPTGVSPQKAGTPGMKRATLPVKQGGDAPD